MTVEDLEMNREVRTVFARNWVNLQKLDYNCVNGVLYARGRLTLLRPPPPRPGEDVDRAGVTASFLKLLEKQLHKLSGLRGIRWQLDGWMRTTSDWARSGL